MEPSLSCPLCGAKLPEAGAKSCPRCGGRLVPDVPRPLNANAKTRVGDYFIECSIGSGGMGEVYLAKQISMKREVALKLLPREVSSDAKYLERFFREVRLLAQLEHHNVVRAIEAGMDGDVCYFSMEYVPGKDLKRQIDLGRRFDEQEALRIAREVASALKYAWDKHKLIHRDVKPANVILTPDGTVKLMDLGISKKQFESSDITLAGMMVGSPTYISPEQARSEKDMDFRADMYSLGASLFHMLAGQPPYDADTPVAVISMHLGAPVQDVRERRTDISKATASLIMKMMAKDKKDRFGSWDEAIAQIDSIMERRKTAKQRDSASPDATSPSQERFIPSAAAAQAKAASFMTAALKWRPELLASQPRHRIIALLGLLVLILLAFASVVNRSLKDARAAEESKALKAAIAAAESCSPASRPAVIAQLEKIARTASQPVSSAALNCIDSIQKKMIREREAAEIEAREAALRAVKAKSYVLESSGDFHSAIKLWNDFADSGDFRNDPKTLQEIKNAVSYLKRMKSEKEAGLE